MNLYDIFEKSDREKQLEAENEKLKAMLAAQNAKKKSPNAGKTKYITRQCRYCGYRVTTLAGGLPPGSFCPKRGKSQPHVWHVIGYQYK